MNEKINKMMYKFIATCAPFIGYKFDENLKRDLDDIFGILSSVFKLCEEEASYAKNLMHELFKIYSYSDYCMLLKEDYGIDPNVFLVGEIYFNLLEKKQSKVNVYNPIYMRQSINMLFLDGTPNTVGVKAFLNYIGDEKNVGMEMFKIAAYACDSFYFKVLAYLDKPNEEYYSDIYACYKEKMNCLDLNEDKYSKETMDECDIINFCYYNTLVNKRINLDLLKYAVDMTVLPNVRKYHISNGTYLLTKRNIKIGF